MNNSSHPPLCINEILLFNSDPKKSITDYLSLIHQFTLEANKYGIKINPCMLQKNNPDQSNEALIIDGITQIQSTTTVRREYSYWESDQYSMIDFHMRLISEAITKRNFTALRHLLPDDDLIAFTILPQDNINDRTEASWEKTITSSFITMLKDGIQNNQTDIIKWVSEKYNNDNIGYIKDSKLQGLIRDCINRQPSAPPSP